MKQKVHSNDVTKLSELACQNHLVLAWAHLVLREAQGGPMRARAHRAHGGHITAWPIKAQEEPREGAFRPWPGPCGLPLGPSSPDPCGRSWALGHLIMYTAKWSQKQNAWPWDLPRTDLKRRPRLG